jgi:hypothetical protein
MGKKMDGPLVPVGVKPELKEGFYSRLEPPNGTKGYYPLVPVTATNWD